MRNMRMYILRGNLFIKRVNIILADNYVRPTTIVLSCKDMPNLSNVNCVR